MESKFLKRICSLAIVVVMVLSMLPANVFAAALTDDKCPACENHDGTWSALTATSGALTTGHYRLSANLTLTAALTVAADQVVCIDLAGYNITAPNKNNVRALEIAAGGTLTVLDSSANETGVISGGKVYTNTSSGKVYGGNVYNEGTFNLYGGTISNGRAQAATAYQAQNYGGNIACMEGSVFNMYGGTLTGGNIYRTLLSTSVVSGGGNIYGKNATIKILGGTVTDGYYYEKYSSSATARRIYSSGGNIFVSGCALTIANATVSDGMIGGTGRTAQVTCSTVAGSTATYYARGGNIYAVGSSTVTIKDGAMISGGVLAPKAITSTTAETNPGSATVNAYGGNIYIYNSKLDIQGGTITGGSVSGTVTKTTSAGSVEEGKVNALGGNIYAIDTEVTMTGGTISEGVCTYVSGISDTCRGGNLYVSYDTGSSSLTMSGGIISGGSAYDSGNIYTSQPTTINGTAQVLNGTSRSYGGNIYYYGSTHTIGGSALIDGGESTASNGGNVYMTVSAKVTLADDAVISNGTAYDGGGNVFCNTNSQFYMTGGTVKDGVSLWETAGTYWGGGNFEVFNGADLYIYDGVISGGTAKLYANSLVVRSDANIFLYGGEIQGTDADNDLPLYANINKTEGYKLYAYNGKVAFDPTADLAACACAVDNGDGTWTVWHVGATADGTACTADNCSFLADEKVGTLHTGEHTYGEDYLCVYCGQMAVAIVIDAEGNATCFDNVLDALQAADGTGKTVHVLRNASVKLTGNFTASDYLNDVTISTAEGVTLTDTSGTSSGKWYARNVTFAAGSNIVLNGNPFFYGENHIYGNVDLYMTTIKGTVTVHGDQGGFLRHERNLFLEGTMNVIGANDGEVVLEGNYHTNPYQIALGSKDSNTGEINSTGTLNVTDATLKFDTILIISGSINLDNSIVNVTECGYDGREHAVIVTVGNINMTNGSALVLEQDAATIQVAEGQAITLDATSTITVATGGLQNVGIVVADGFDGCVWYEDGTYAVKAHNGAAASCTADGLCTNCNAVVNEKLPHSLAKTDAVKDTCTAAGNSEYWTCETCGKYFSDAEGKTEISEGDWVIDEITDHAYAEDWSKNETHHWHACANDAEHKDSYAEHVYEYASNGVGTCVCGATKDCEHTYEYTSNNDATCEADGTKHGVCSTCGNEINVADEGSATGHDYEGKETLAPTCVAEGEMTYTCKNGCGHSYTQPIPVNKDNHVEEKQVEAKAATCVEAGWNAYVYCTKCDYTTKVEQPKLEHNYTYTPAENKTHTVTCDKGCNRNEVEPCEDKDADNVCDKCKAVLAVYVAEVNGTQYESLQDAIDAANGGTVILLNPVNLSEKLIIDKDVTIDLSKYTITGANSTIALEIKANVTLQNGAVSGYVSGSSNGVIKVTSGKLTLKDVVLTSTGTSRVNRALRVQSDAAAELTGCTVTGYISALGTTEIRSGTYYGIEAGDSIEGIGIAIYGGTFYYELTVSEVADGFKPKALGNGVWTVVESTFATDLIITDIYELQMFRDMVNAGDSFNGKTVKLAANIDLNNVTWDPIGKNENTVFSGTFDGQGYTISNLSVTNGNNRGLFGAVKNATIKDLTVHNAKVLTQGTGIGVVVGRSFAALVLEDVHVTGLVEVTGNNYVGGMVGYAWGDYTNCSVEAADNSYVQGNVPGNTCYVGGMVGWQGEGNNQIVNCSVSNITVKALSDGDSHSYGAGGLVGLVQHGNIVKGCSVTNVTIQAGEETMTGSVVGANNGTAAAPSMIINNTVSNVTATVGGTETAVGISGANNSVTMQPTEATVIGTGVELNASGKLIAGVFEQDVTAYVAEGYVLLETDGVYTVHKHVYTYAPAENKTHTVGCEKGDYTATEDCVDEDADKYCDLCDAKLIDPVAEVDGEEYESFAEAWADVNTNGGTIKLMADVELTEKLTVTGAVTLNLNGHEISGNFDDAFGMIYVKKGASLTVKSGTVANAGGIAIGNYGTVTVAADATVTGAAAAIYNFYYQADYYGTAAVSGKANIIWNCGELTIDESAVVDYLDNSGAATISGTVTELYAQDGSDCPAVEGAGTLTIVDPSNVTLDEGFILWEVEEGVYKVHAHAHERVYTDPTNTENGYWTYTCVCGDNYVEVEEGTMLHYAVNEATGESYATVQAALNAATAGDTVKVLKDATEENLFVGVGIKLDLNGNKLTVTGSMAAPFSTSHIIDNTNGEGLLVLNSTDYSLNGYNEQLPMWTAEGVRFTAASFREKLTIKDENTAQYAFYLNMDLHNSKLGEVLANGSAGTGITIRIKVTYTTANGMTAVQYFELTSDMVKQYVESDMAVALTVTGIQGRADLTFTAEITSTNPNDPKAPVVVIDKVDN